jgi:cytochrome c-type biogenesis protein CcmH/NrfF
MLFTEVTIWISYSPPANTPQILIIIMGPTLALFIGFGIWGWSIREKNEEIEHLEEKVYELAKQLEIEREKVRL